MRVFVISNNNESYYICSLPSNYVIVFFQERRPCSLVQVGNVISFHFFRGKNCTNVCEHILLISNTIHQKIYPKLFIQSNVKDGIGVKCVKNHLKILRKFYIHHIT